MKHSISLIMTSLMLISKTRAQPHLFKKFSRLQDQIAHISLCDLPTPIVKLEQFGDAIGCNNIFMKRDDVTGKMGEDGIRLYGGNKPRKLEFLLADALASGAHGVVTCGSAGSNHAVATTVYANEVGLATRLFLKPQPNSRIVRHNLLLDHYYGAELHAFPTKKLRDAALQDSTTDGSWYTIPAGGSTPVGILGFVNAACELADQIAREEMAQPDRIYVAMGSCGTVAGLLLGLQAVVLGTKVIAISVEPEEFPDEYIQQIEKLFVQTNELLHAADATFPLFEFPHDALIINTKFCGTEYGLFTPDAMEAATMCKETEDTTLDGTYTARPVAAIIDDVAQGLLQDKVVLFWNTYCGLDYSAFTATVDYKNLPAEFHRYFEEEVQLLDQE